MAKLLSRYRDLITGLLVENGMSKDDAKTYLKKGPSGTELGVQLYDLYLASLQQVMNDYASQYGTAIDLFSDNENATQVIATANQSNLSSNQGMDGSGDYYNQFYFSSVNSLTSKLLYLSRKRFNLINKELEELFGDVNQLAIRIEDKLGANSKSFARSISVMNYLGNATTAFNAVPPAELRDLLGPYYSESNLNTLVPDHPSLSSFESPYNYIFYTSELTVQNTSTNIDLPPQGLIFAIQQVTTEPVNVPVLSQALYGDATINFADAPVMNVLYLLGAGANGDQSGDLIINFADGSTPLAYTLNFTDWANNKNQKPKKHSNPSLSLQSKPYNDEIVLEYFKTYVNTNKNGVGKAENNYRYIFGYGINVDSSSPVSSIDFNFDDNVKILAASYL
jgi:hypothetical protein